jgi:hypothetical protein
MNKKLVFAIACMTAGQAALAGGTVTGHVVNVRIDHTGKGVVYFDVNLTGSPTCIESTYSNGLAFDTATPAGRAIMARALAAKATDDLIKAVGSGACTIYENGWVEDWLYGDIE